MVWLLLLVGLLDGWLFWFLFFFIVVWLLIFDYKRFGVFYCDIVVVVNFL